MSRKIFLITAVAGAALAFSVPAAWGDSWFADRQSPESVHVSPDLADRAVAARQNELSTVLDARERALGAGRSTTNPIDSREQSFIAKRQAQLTAGGLTPDPVRDDRFRLDPSSFPAPAATTSSGSEVEWPQIGIGFGIGVLLVLGLVLAVKATRIRPLAH